MANHTAGSPGAAAGRMTMTGRCDQVTSRASPAAQSAMSMRSRGASRSPAGPPNANISAITASAPTPARASSLSVTRSRRRAGVSGTAIVPPEPTRQGTTRPPLVVCATHGRRHEGAALAERLGVAFTPRPPVEPGPAGLGRDAFVLAARGCDVTLVERDPVVAALLDDGLARARADEATNAIVARMTALEADATTVLGRESSDVVVIDPMHPPRRKSAAVKKEMRVLRARVGTDPDSAHLLAAARQAARERVVVKRPKGAEPLAGLAPSGAVTGRTTRFDIYKGLAQPS
ncbi:MAG: hypothetical protein BRD57_04265 [Proteobacteria bacterium SW_6_67_9]|nr:MAG: hypothetical protein BRD57_04265 [Proteobacteria bacterium SW_6_67_9]